MTNHSCHHCATHERAQSVCRKPQILVPRPYSHSVYMYAIAILRRDQFSTFAWSQCVQGPSGCRLLVRIEDMTR